jgi:hypothetical protein
MPGRFEEVLGEFVNLLCVTSSVRDLGIVKRNGE